MTAALAGGSLQQRLARLACGEVVATPQGRAMVRHSIRDAVAVAVAAGSEPSVHVALRYASDVGLLGDAWVWGTSTRLAPQQAAFVNGTMVQALEFDDIASVPAAHMSSVVVPVLSAFGERINPDRAVDGIIQGLRVGTVLGDLISREAYARGLQPTHTIGPVAAIGALGHAMGLSTEQVCDAIGLVAIQGLGLRANTGTLSKAMQSGLIASAAVRSVQLAEAGACAGSAVLDSLLTLFGVDAPVVAAAADGDDASVAPLSLSLKLYPSCGAAHPAIELVLGLREELGSSGEDPVSMEVRVPPRVPKAMHFVSPATPEEARFSLHYCITTAWRRGNVGIDSFTESGSPWPAPPAPAWLRIVPDDTFEPQGEQCEVVVQTSAGVARRRVEFREGYPERPITEAQIEEKARTCLGRVFSTARTAALLRDLVADTALPTIGPLTAPETTRP